MFHEEDLFFMTFMPSETLQFTKILRIKNPGNSDVRVSQVSYLLLSENCRLHLFSLSAATILQPGAQPALQAVLQSPACSLLLLPWI